MLRKLTVTFPKIEAKETVKTFCKECKKKCQITLHDWQSISPFNKKTPEQIRKEVNEKLIAQKKDVLNNGTICKSCKWGDNGKANTKKK